VILKDDAWHHAKAFACSYWEDHVSDDDPSMISARIEFERSRFPAIIKAPAPIADGADPSCEAAPNNRTGAQPSTEKTVAGVDGPSPPSLFVWKGKTERLQPAAWILLNYLWPRRHGPVEYAAACEAAANGSPDSVSDKAMANRLNRIRTALLAAGHSSGPRKADSTLIWTSN
jgi:hypothetical protein